METDDISDARCNKKQKTEHQSTSPAKEVTTPAVSSTSGASNGADDINIDQHPHCTQLSALCCKGYDKSPQKWRPALRFLNGDVSWPSMSYQRRADSDRSSNHWGQLKLCESELLVLMDNPSATVIYAGAAPGKHVISLARRFPKATFELYDPAPFDGTVVDFAKSSDGRVQVRNDFFNEECARKVAERETESIIFICDIRTADPQQMKQAEVEKTVWEDHVRQMEWAKTINADVSLLKFRLPWGEGTTEYFDGKIMVQIYPPCTSTETRLLVTKADLAKPLKKYDQKQYEEQLMFHNTVQRALLFPHQVKVDGLDFCYDCRALVDTMSRFIKSDDPDEIGKAIESLVEDINDNGRSLATRYSVSSSRKAARFARKRFRDAEGNDSFSVEKRQKTVEESGGKAHRQKGKGKGKGKKGKGGKNKDKEDEKEDLKKNMEAAETKGKEEEKNSKESDDKRQEKPREGVVKNESEKKLEDEKD